MGTLIWILIIGAGAYFIYKNRELIEQFLNGGNKTLSQEDRVIDYFSKHADIPGRRSSMKNATKDEEFDAIVANSISKDEVRIRAVAELGLDESQLIEIEPIYFDNYYYGTPEDVEDVLEIFYNVKLTLNDLSDKTQRKKLKEVDVIIGTGKDGKLRSSVYQVTWLFSTQNQICIYQEVIRLHNKETEKITRQFLWRNIVSITGSQSTLRVKEVTERYDTFRIVVPGDEFTCSMFASEYTRRSINAIRQKLTEQ